MKSRLIHRARLISARSVCFASVCLAAAFILTGCDDDDFSHTPPEGQGAIIVDNHTVNDISVFIDGRAQGEVRDFKDRAYDLDPGVYRLVLEEQDGKRNFRGDVDVVEGRNTVVDVAGTGFGGTRYDVIIFFD